MGGLIPQVGCVLALGQIGTDGQPIVPAVVRFENAVRATVEACGLVHRWKEGRHPGETQSRLISWKTWLDALRLARAHLLAHEAAELMFIVDRVTVARVSIGEIGITAAPAIQVDVLPLIGPAIFRNVSTRPEQGGIVLSARVDVVGLVHVVRDSVTLGNRQVVHVQPILAAVIREEQATVISEHDAIGVQRIDPHRMCV